MYYSFSYTPTILDTQDSPHKLDMPMQAGVIHQVDIIIPDGANSQVFITVNNDIQQLSPTNPDGALSGNAIIISYREWQELQPGKTNLHALIWSTLLSSWPPITINIGILPKRILQPLAWDELLKAAKGK